MDPKRQPRLMTRVEAATYCGLSVQSFSRWVRVGRLPDPLEGTARWDLRAIDIALDRLSHISCPPDVSNPFDHWISKKNARQLEGDT